MTASTTDQQHPIYDPVGAGAPTGQHTIQHCGCSDGSLDIEFWFDGKRQLLNLKALEPVALAISLAEETVSPLSCVSGVEPFLRVLVSHGWLLKPPGTYTPEPRLQSNS